MSCYNGWFDNYGYYERGAAWLVLKDDSAALSMGETGAPCDLTLMPWLPQLLAAFRNVPRSAVDGVGGSKADSNNAGADPGVPRSEYDALRDQIKKQDSELKIARQREKELEEQLSLHEEQSVRKEELEMQELRLKSETERLKSLQLQIEADRQCVQNERRCLMNDLEAFEEKRRFHASEALKLENDRRQFQKDNTWRRSLGGISVDSDESTRVPDNEAAETVWINSKIKLTDLKCIGTLGYGAFSEVKLCEHPSTGQTFALKAISKGHIVKESNEDMVMNEKAVLTMLDSRFITKLYETYNDAQTLYFLLEPCLGGDLLQAYQRENLYGSMLACRFYSSCVILALQHMHQKNIIYRDLKPENLLLTEAGQLKVTDMGVAKEVTDKTYTMCGTPEYIAPEVIAGTGHTSAVDWWALGILIYELMAKRCPFEGSSEDDIFEKINGGIEHVIFPQAIDEDCHNLIESLVKKDVADRLAMRPGGVKNVTEHKWFAEFDWGALKTQAMAVPYQPAVTTRRDLQNFDPQEDHQPEHVPYIDPGTGWDKDFATCI